MRARRAIAHSCRPRSRSGRRSAARRAKCPPRRPPSSTARYRAAGADASSRTIAPSTRSRIDARDRMQRSNRGGPVPRGDADGQRPARSCVDPIDGGAVDGERLLGRRRATSAPATAAQALSARRRASDRMRRQPDDRPPTRARRRRAAGSGNRSRRRAPASPRTRRRGDDRQPLAHGLERTETEAFIAGGHRSASWRR